MTIGRTILMGACVVGLNMPAATLAAGDPQDRAAEPPRAAEKCERRLPPLALYGAANDLLEAAYYAQWVLEDITCKEPENIEARKALDKLNRAISKAEGR